MTYPGAGVPLSTGSAWGTSYTVGTAANNLVQLNGAGQLPAVPGTLLTSTFTGTLVGSATTLQGAIQTIGTELDGQDELLFDADDFTETAETGTVTLSLKLNASGFSNNLSPTDDTLQEIANAFDSFEGTDGFVYQADCSTITNGACVDTDTGNLYYYDGSAVAVVSLDSTQPVAMQQVFTSSGTLVAGTGSKTKAITGVGWTTADIGCDASDTLGVSVKTSLTINGAYTEIGTVSLTAAAQNTAVDISSWADISAGTWVRIDLTGTPAAATECTIVIEGVEQ